MPKEKTPQYLELATELLATTSEMLKRCAELEGECNDDVAVEHLLTCADELQEIIGSLRAGEYTHEVNQIQGE